MINGKYLLQNFYIILCNALFFHDINSISMRYFVQSTTFYPATPNEVPVPIPRGVISWVFIADFQFQYRPWEQTLITDARNQWLAICQTDSKSQGL